MSRAALGTGDEPKWITEETLFALHAQQIERYGGMHGVIDSNVVHSALARAKNRWAYDEKADFADLAAVYLIAFAGSQGFHDGNKRTGLACALVFLAQNAVLVEFEAQSLLAMCLRVANHEVDDGEVADFVRAHVKDR